MKRLSLLLRGLLLFTVFQAIAPAQEVLEVACWGMAELQPSEVMSRIKTIRGDAVDQLKLNADRETIASIYKAKGFYYAQVAVDQTRSKNGEGLIIIFTIVEGPKVEIGTIHFEGNLSFSKSDLLGAMPRTKEHGAGTDAPFVAEDVERDIVQLSRFYQSQGFLDARATLLGRSPSADFTRVVLRIGIDEGPRYVVHSIHLEGMTSFDPESFRQAMSTRIGSPYRPGVELGRDIRKLIGVYENGAYLQVAVRDASTIDVEHNQVDVVLRVSEGKRTLVGEVIIEGNPETREKVLKRR